jgi:hypothetical protein
MRLSFHSNSHRVTAEMTAPCNKTEIFSSILAKGSHVYSSPIQGEACLPIRFE